jgi:hypothetical protein
VEAHEQTEHHPEVSFRHRFAPKASDRTPPRPAHFFLHNDLRSSPRYDHFTQSEQKEPADERKIPTPARPFPHAAV